MTFACPEVTIRPYFVKPVKANLVPESVHISENSVINSDIFFKSHYFTLTVVLWACESSHQVTMSILKSKLFLEMFFNA